MKPAGGLNLFADQLHPQALRDVLAWEHDAELAGLFQKLRSHTERKQFFDAWAEAMTARHLRARGCALRFEVPTPHQRQSDFEVSRDGLRFYLHVKRIDSDRPSRRHLVISSRLRVLERIPQSYIVQVRWNEGLADDQMQLLVAQAEEFIRHARVGDEMRARDHDGTTLGGVRVIAPHEGKHVSVTIGLPTGFIDLSPRMRKLLNRAHEQFMPGEENVIMICSSHGDDALDFEAALLGTHVERWDQFPPRGRRIAHGRAPDGFWSGRRFADSAFATWACFAANDEDLHSRLYVRRGGTIDPAMTALLTSLFDANSSGSDASC
jgi:hypothetical protein